MILTLHVVAIKKVRGGGEITDPDVENSGLVHKIDDYDRRNSFLDAS